MSLNKETARKVAHLARIAMSEEELEIYAEKISKIIGFVEQLAEVDTDAVEPLPSPVDIPLRLRADAVTDGACAAAVLANAPEEMEGFYVVSKVVE